MPGTTFWRWFWRISRWSFFGLLAVIVVDGLAIALPNEEPAAFGCYWASWDDGVLCKGFFAGTVVSYLFNWTFGFSIFIPPMALATVTSGSSGPFWLVTVGIVIFIAYLFAILTPLRWLWRGLRRFVPIGGR